MWIGSQDGLSRFDGREFVSFYKKATQKQRLCGSDIRSLAEDSIDNLLWVLPGEYGLNAIDLQTSKVVKTIPIKTGKPDEWHICMTLLDRKLWIGTFSGLQVYNIGKNRFEAVPVPKAERGALKEISIIWRDHSNNIWVFYNEFGIVIYNAESLWPVKMIANDKVVRTKNQTIRYNSILQESEGSLLVATNEGMKRFIFDKAYDLTVNHTPVAGHAELNSVNVDFITKDKKGNFLITGNGSVYLFTKDLASCQVLKEENASEESDWLSSVQNIFIDEKNNYWLSCKQGLAFIRNQSQPFERIYYDVATGNKLEHVHCLNKLDDGNIMAGLRNGLAFINHKTNQIRIQDKANLYHHCFTDNLGNIIASSSVNNFVYINGIQKPISSVYNEFRPFQSMAFNSHVQLGDSVFVLGTEYNMGILYWNYKKHTIRQINSSSTPLSLGADIVNKVFLDKRRRLWVLSDNSITLLSENFSKSSKLKFDDPVTHEPLGLFFSICESNGSYWISSYASGILQVDSNLILKQVINSGDGLTNDGVYELFTAGDTSIYITTNHGLSVFNTRTSTFRNYYQSDGLHSDAFEEACGMMKNGLIYAGGVNGFTVIDPAKFTMNSEAPRVYFNRIVIETSRGKIDTSDFQLQKLYIPNTVLQTTLHLSAISYSNSDRITSAWRILENNTEWTNIGTQNFIPLIGLSPGTYHLQIKAANEDGVWSEPKELILVFLPKWYQTWWFYLLVALTVAAMLYALYRYRISQIKKQHEIRKNIATDLHDDLGSTLNSVKVFTNLAISGIKQEESLQQVKDNLTEATMSLRDMIWVLDDSLDTVDELVTRLKQFAIPVAAASRMEAGIKADSEVSSRLLTKEEKRNLFLICKEAVNNSIKYSGGTQISVHIRTAGKKIQVVITDNGKGFAEVAVKKGYGLKNMQYRAEQIKYTATIISSPGKGTQVEIKPAE